MPTLLVVDDEVSVRQFVKDAMTRRGWFVMGVSSVDAGLAVAQASQVDVALCDVVMPHAGGPEFARGLQSVPAQVPLVLMSGHPAPWARFDQPLAPYLEPVPVLEKPFNMAQLQTILEGALNQKCARST